MTEPQKLIQEHLAHTSWGILGNQGYILGVDLGGYGLRIALINLQNQTYTSTYADMQLAEPQTMLEQALPLIHKLLDETGVAPGRLVRIGVGFGGPVHPHRGVVLLSPRIPGWQNFSLKDHFEQEFDTVTLIDNDANLIALGEATFGIGHGCQHLFYLHLSSGVGGGIVIDGRLYHGATTTAGEIGHAVVGHDWDGNRHQKSATLEELVSVDGLLRRARGAGLTTNNLEDLFSDQPIAQHVVEEIVDLLAIRIAHVSSTRPSDRCSWWYCDTYRR